MTARSCVLVLAAPRPSGAPLRKVAGSAKARRLGEGREAARGGRAALPHRARPLSSVQALLQRARLAASAGNAAGALPLQALDLAPNSEEVLSPRPGLWAAPPVPAIVALEALTRMNPTVAEYRYLLGVALLQAGDSPARGEALAEAERLDRAPAHPGRARPGPERPQAIRAGRALLERALALSPRTSRPWRRWRRRRRPGRAGRARRRTPGARCPERRTRHGQPGAAAWCT